MSLVDRKPNKHGIPYLSKADIEQIAVDYLASYNRPLLELAQPLDVDDFAENHLGIALDFAELSNNGSVLGMIAFSDCIIEAYNPKHHGTRRLSVKAGTAVIDSSVVTENEYRGRFTIAHECAHWIIHRPVQLIYPNQIQLNLDQTVLDESKVIVCRRSSLLREEIWPHQIRDWREWQADYLAACLLMPPFAVSNFVNSLKQKNQDALNLSIRHTDGSEHDRLTATLIKEVSDNFQVSSQAAEVRLMQLNLLSPNFKNQITLEEKALSHTV